MFMVCPFVLHVHIHGLSLRFVLFVVAFFFCLLFVFVRLVFWFQCCVGLVRFPFSVFFFLCAIGGFL